MFGLTWALLECDAHTTLDDFGVGILVKEERYDYFGKNDSGLNDDVRRLCSTRRVQLTRDIVLHNVGLTTNGQSNDVKITEAFQSSRQSKDRKRRDCKES